MVLKIHCILESPSVFKILMPRPYHLITLKSLGVGPRHQDLFKLWKEFLCAIRFENQYTREAGTVLGTHERYLYL